MTTKIDAIQSLCPKAQFVTGGTSDSDLVIAEWHSAEMTQPTEAEIDAEVIRLQAEYDAQEYSRNRRMEYPKIGDQLDMIYHNGDGGTTFQAAIKAVKDKYPKE